MSTSLSFFSPQKNETKKALVAASIPMAIGYLPYTLSFPKNDKLAALKQAVFLTVTLSLQSALQMPRKKQSGNALINVKTTF